MKIEQRMKEISFEAEMVQVKYCEVAPYAIKEMSPSTMGYLSQAHASEGITSIARPKGDGFEVVWGTYPIILAQQAGGFDCVNLLVADLSDEEAISIALAYGKLTCDVDPVTLAEAYKAACEHFKRSRTEIADIAETSRSSLANHIRLLDMKEELLQEIKQGKVPFNHARQILSLTGKEKDGTLHQHIQEQRRLIKLSSGSEEERISAAKLAEEIKMIQSGTRQKAPSRSTGASAEDKHLARLQDLISERIGSPAIIGVDKKNEGAIRIPFFNKELLEGVLEALANSDPNHFRGELILKVEGSNHFNQLLGEIIPDLD